MSSISRRPGTATNLQVSQTRIPLFIDPSSPSSLPSQTDYSVRHRQRDGVRGDKSATIRAVADGTSNTLIMVEVGKSGVNWLSRTRTWTLATDLAAAGQSSER